MKKANMDIREKIKNSKIKQYMIAKKLGISEYTFSRNLREELSIPQKYTIFKAIEDLQHELKE